MNRKHRTHDEYIKELSEKRPNIDLVDDFINMVTKVKHKCKICGYEWCITPHDILTEGKYNLCPQCSKKQSAEKKLNQTYKIGEHIVDDNRDLVITDVVHKKNNKSHNDWLYKYKCNVCGYDCGEGYKNGKYFSEYWISQDSLNRGRGCSCCANRIVSATINSIASEECAIDMLKFFINKEDAKKYCIGYSKKIHMKCPNCGEEKDIAPRTLFMDGFGCCCGDGISYPEKFMFNILTQLNIKFNHNISFDWSKQTEHGRKLYDFYLPDYNCIIETHGAQHYKESFSRYIDDARTLEEEQNNDLFKKELAYQNHINNYFEIDCSKSEPEYICHSMNNAKLFDFLKIDQQNIDFTQAARFASSNLIKFCAELKNKGISNIEIANILKVSRNTIRIYLNKAKKYGFLYDTVVN